MSSVSEPAHDRKCRAVALADRRRDLIGRTGAVSGRENARDARRAVIIHDDVTVIRRQARQERIGREARAQDEDDVRRLRRAVDHKRVRPLGAADLKAVLFAVVIVHVAADLPQEVRLLRRVRRQTDDRRALAAIEHAVTGGAVAHAAAEKLRLARKRAALGDAGCKQERPALHEFLTCRDAERFSHRHGRECPLAQDVRTKITRLLRHGLEQRGAGDIRHTGVICDVPGLIQRAVGRAATDHAHGQIPVARRHGRRQPRRAAADDKQVIHVPAPPSCRFCLNYIFLFRYCKQKMNRV